MPEPDPFGQGGKGAAEPGPDFLARFLDRAPEELKGVDPESPRGRILAAARALFAEGGFDATTTRRIAESAGVNQAMLHYYFHSKERLYETVVAREIFGVLTRIVTGLASLEEPAEIVVSVPRLIMTAFREDPIKRKILRREIAEGGERISRIVKGMGLHGPIGVRSIVLHYAAEAQERGRLRDLPVEAIGMFLIANSFGFVLLEPLFRVVLDRDFEDDQTWRDLLENQEKLLRRSVSPVEDGE